MAETLEAENERLRRDLQRAEFKRDQIHAYGADWRLTRSQGAMSATIEPSQDCD